MTSLLGRDVHNSLSFLLTLRNFLKFLDLPTEAINRCKTLLVPIPRRASTAYSSRHDCRVLQYQKQAAFNQPTRWWGGR